MIFHSQCLAMAQHTITSFLTSITCDKSTSNVCALMQSNNHLSKSHLQQLINAAFIYFLDLDMNPFQDIATTLINLQVNSAVLNLKQFLKL